LCSGDSLAAIAITEPNVGSDAAAVETTLTANGDGFVLNGTKKWITCGQIADVFIVLAGTDNGPIAVLLPRDTPGLTVEPIRGTLGCRGYQLASLTFADCPVPVDHLLGKPGFGLSYVIATGLDAGRYNLAWGCVGLAQACLDASLAYSSKRQQFGVPLASHQLVQQMVSHMMCDVHAARLMCRSAGVLRAQMDPAAVKESTMAKYFASKVANKAANHAVQIHGAQGVGPYLPIERYLRDARIMEIIEGSSQVLELAIAQYGFREHRS
jgi:alkylation response protein AidB-like acyl-CoA dehydrogenase